ncbi:two-component hybrid sensor and regulator [Crocosphaera subtropica ATCC 51142]|uniref:Circadian input-output histidine kinase CikA n=1 Tax=Crocosphaera subtropica (strain ATCC 51142 / BH68) TaxID=43989 RepID=B1WQL4_CROS5|nr:hybrid sensor histidine kinase/response regulator [Crocosphaera subtropica]ACB51725.1 two-component hybrid sensor and regulator [Crocosphaera subtropica ATCC 51142]
MKDKQSLLKKISHRIILLSAISLIGFINSIVISYILVTKQIEKSLEQISEQKISTFQLFFETLTTNVLRNRILAHNATQAQKEELLRQIRWRNPAILDVLLVENNGQVVAQSSRSLRPQINHITQQPWLSELQDITQVWFGLVTYELNNYSVTMVVKLTDKLGLPYDNLNLVTRIDLTELLRQLVNQQAGDNNIYIIDQSQQVQRIIVHQDISLLNNKNINTHQIDWNHLEELNIEISPSEELVFAYHKRFDVSVSEPWLKSLQNLVWIVTIEQPLLETILPFLPLFLILIIILFIVIVIVFKIIRFLKFRVITPIKNLQVAVHQINNNQFDLQLNIDTNDELQELSDGFKEMAQALKNSFATLEKKVKERTKQLEKANQAKREFLGNINHELRTPLNLIIGYIDRLYQDGYLNNEQKKQLDIIDRNSQHLLSLINQILDISKIESGHITLQENSFNLSQLLTNLQEVFNLSCYSKGLNLILENKIEDKLNYIYADKNKLKQILINLLHNAVKFTDKGMIKISAEVSNHRSLHYSKNQPNYTLRIQVKDTGKGIAREEISQLFKAFEQTQTGRNLNQGTGLGLYISHQFIKLMGGNITVESSPHSGTTFTLEIPVKLSQKDLILSQPTVKKVIGLANHQTHYRILVVDDDLESRDLLVNMLLSVGLSVQAANNGQEAISLWQQWQPHLIWMDLQMPIIDGCKATQHIKKASHSQFPYIILVTADASETVRKKALFCGCDDFVAKPYHGAIIWEKMTQYLGLQYIYEQDKDQDQTPSFPDINSVDLVGIPREWLSQIYQASLHLQGKKVLALIQEIAKSHPILAQYLTQLAEGYQFEKIINLLEDYYSN